MASFSILNLEDKEKWNAFLNRLPIEQQDIYFTPEYYQLYEEYGDGKAQCFVFEKENKIALYPYLINSLNETGFNLDGQYFDIQGAYGYNGIVSSSDSDNFILDFYACFNDFVNSENIIAEFTRFHPLLKNHHFSERYMNIFFNRKTMFIDLNRSYADIFGEFQTTTRKQIRRCANKYHLEVEIIENDITQIDIFYAIYKDAMDRVQSDKYLYFDKDYFEKLLSTTKSALFIAKYEEKPIAAIIAFYNSFYIHGHLGGALTEYLNTSSYSLLYSEMIKFGLKNGCKYFHAGGGATNSQDDSLMQFKLNFSKKTSDFYVGSKIHNNAVYDKIIKQWSERYPQKAETYKNFTLKYRY
jgi:lipid II:glycine glycyltransferase (peptidoglycan interpeptide bridge formation enzyme)